MIQLSTGDMLRSAREAGTPVGLRVREVMDRGELVSDAIVSALRDRSGIIVDPSMDALIDLANQFAAEHVSLQVKDADAVLKQLVHAGAVFIGPFSPVAAGDYIAGPSHVLPTYGSARFASALRVDDFIRAVHVVSLDESALSRVATTSAVSRTTSWPQFRQYVRPTLA